MLYHISLALKKYISVLNVVHYVSFRAIAALISSFLVSLLFGERFIGISRGIFRSRVRRWLPQTHQVKNNMPTMGGAFVLLVVLLNVLIWCNLLSPAVWACILCMFLFGVVGFWDDYLKIRRDEGITPAVKFSGQIVAALIPTLVWLYFSKPSTEIYFPFLKNLHPDLGWGFVVWVVFVVVATSNAVNLTDGLDGLALGSLIPNFATFSIIAYLAGSMIFSDYLMIPFAQCAELTVIGTILVGTCLGFLWYNAYPAQIFMGDVGSVSLGGVLGMLAVICKQELLLLIAGGLFVVETLSVMAQVVSFKLYGRRIFRMAPIHHHFELAGWPESRITVRFGIISLILCLLSLITLKIR